MHRLVLGETIFTLAVASALASGCGGTDAPARPQAFDVPPAPTVQQPPPTVMPMAGGTATPDPVIAQPTAGSMEQPTTPPEMPGTEVMPPENVMPPTQGPGCVLAMDECPELDSGWPGDEFCIKPPPADKGFQVHVGPPSYDNPPANYITQPGQDTNRFFSAVSGNTEEVFYYYRQYRMRSGSHHLILSAGGSGVGAGGVDAGGRLGGSSNSAKDNPDCNVVAPENQDIGMRLGPRTNISFNMHYFNQGDEPVLNEAWVNFWYKPASEVKQETRELFQLGNVAFAIPPGAHQVIGPNSCRVNGDGRIVTMYGHFHANTVRFSAWRTRGGQKELILEDYDWHDPLILEYSSAVQNPAPNPAIKSAGGWNGPLDIKTGDTLTWECEVQNQTNGTLRFANEAVTGEMCILVGDTVGAGCGIGGF